MAGARSLRTQLILGSVALTGMAGIAIGAASILGVRGFMLSQLDDEVRQTAQLITSLNREELRERIDGPGLPVGTVIAVASYGSASAVRLDERAHAEVLADDDLHDLTSGVHSREPQSVHLGDLGSYRFVSASERGDESILVGLPTGVIDRTLGRIGLFTFGLLTAVLAIVAFVTRRVIDNAINPLEEMRHTALSISRSPIGTGDTTITERVDVTDPESEVGELGTAFNQMLDHVDEALTARRASEAKVRQFVSDASHELRTPLTAIRGYSELTRRLNMDVSDDVRHALARIESESIRMTELVEDLLLLARLDEGRELATTKVDVAKVVKDAVNDATVAGPDHTWTVKVGRGLSVTADKHRLHQVITNLLANARTHTPAGTTVTVTATGSDTDIVITVADNGPGIPADIRESLFERFVRADTSRQRATGSTGLGLAIVDGLVRAHKGTITVDSEPGDTRFIITLPRHA
ncbi:MAG: sensor histidine kinase [Microbacteriaceae bacterium]